VQPPFDQSAANGSKEPNLTNAARCTNVRYHESDQKPSTTTWVLNGVFGGVKRDGLSMCQKGAFLEHAKLWLLINLIEAVTLGTLDKTIASISMV
jgi:hypothetical protein